MVKLVKMDINKELFRLYQVQIERRVRKGILESMHAPKGTVEGENALLEKINSEIESYHAPQYEKDTTQLMACRDYFQSLISSGREEIFGECSVCKHLDRTREAEDFFCLKEKKDCREVLEEKVICFKFEKDEEEVSLLPAGESLPIARKFFTEMHHAYLRKYPPSRDMQRRF